MMDQERIVEVNVMSAHDLKDVQLIGKMRTYVVAWIEEECKFSTRVSDKGKNPSWNEIIKLPISQKKIELGYGYLTLEIYCSGIVFPKLVGSVAIRISHLVTVLARTARRNEFHECKPSVLRPSGKEQGTLCLAIRIVEKPGQKQIQPSWLPHEPAERQVQSRSRQNAHVQKDEARGEGTSYNLATYYHDPPDVEQLFMNLTSPLPQEHQRRASSPLERLYYQPPPPTRDESLRPLNLPPLPSPPIDIPLKDHLARLYPPPLPHHQRKALKASRRSGARSGAAASSSIQAEAGVVARGLGGIVLDDNAAANVVPNRAANVVRRSDDDGGSGRDRGFGILNADW